MLELFLNDKFFASMHVCFGERIEVGRKKKKEGKKEKRENLFCIAHVSNCFALGWSVSVSWTTSASIFNHYDLILLTDFHRNIA